MRGLTIDRGLPVCVDAHLNRDRYSLYQKYLRLQSLLVTVVQELEWLSSQVRTDKDRIPLLATR